MKFLRINWTHGRAKAEEYMRARKRLKFALVETGEIAEGYIIAFHGEVHAMIEIESRRPMEQRRRKPSVWRQDEMAK